MLRKFAAAMLATALIAGPALAASPAGNAGSTPATVTAPASTTVNKPMAKPATKMVKHFRSHVARRKVGKIKVAHHFNSTKAPRHHLVLRPVKHSKFSKAGKVNKINKISKLNRSNKSTHS
jgi:hypothetical protein